MRFCKEVRKLLGEEYEVTFYFNPGGPAVWGETFVKIRRNDPTSYGHLSVPVVEACLSVEFSYIRQWDGHASGKNVRIHYTDVADPKQFALTVQLLAARPFVRF